MTARHASPVLAIEIEAAGGARELTLRDRTGLVPEEMIVETRPSETGPQMTALTIEMWSGNDLSGGTVHLTAPQLYALAAVARAAAAEAEARK